MCAAIGLRGWLLVLVCVVVSPLAGYALGSLVLR